MVNLYYYKETILVAWIGGAAVRFMESLSDAKIMMDIEVFMNQYLSKEYPNMAPPEEILVRSYLSVKSPRNGIRTYPKTGISLVLESTRQRSLLLPDSGVCEIECYKKVSRTSYEWKTSFCRRGNTSQG